jgi:hypothetical protein
MKLTPVDHFLQGCTVFVTLIAAVLFLLLAIPKASVIDIGKPCRGHHGVADWVPAPLFEHRDGHKGIVVCRDGKVGEVK